MRMSDLVSVVIPAHNQAEYLREAIQSVFDQTCDNWEIVVVDDGSTDHTREVCVSFGPRVRYYFQENDGTQGAGARLRAMRLAQGAWIALLDHDDRWLPTKLEQQLQAVAADPACGLAFTGWQQIDGQGSRVGDSTEVPLSGDCFHLFLIRNPAIASSGMFRRSLLARLDETDLLLGPGDYVLWLGISRQTSVTSIPAPLVELRRHSQCESNDRAWEARAIQACCLRQRENLHPDCRECVLAWREGYASALYRLSLSSRSRSGRLRASHDRARAALATPSWKPKIYRAGIALMTLLLPRRFYGLFAQ